MLNTSHLVVPSCEPSPPCFASHGPAVAPSPRALTAALRLQTRGAYGALLYFSREKLPVYASRGKLAIIDGKWLRLLKHGSSPNHWNLYSMNGSPMESNVKVKKAFPILGMKY